MRPVRAVQVAAYTTVAAALFAGCGGQDSGTGAPGVGTAAGRSSSATPSATPSGNGIEKLPMAEVARRTGQALQNAVTVRIRANLTSDGQRIRMDFRMARNRGAVGTMSINGVTLELLRLKKDAYLKATAAAWQKLSGGDGAAAALLAGKWVKVPTNDKEFGPVLDFTDPASLAKEIFGGDVLDAAAEPTVTRVRLRGVDAVKLTDPDGSAIYIAATGKPYPLRLESKDPKDAGTFDLGEYGRPFTLATPPADQVIDTTS